jgi:8-oxo-dGTP pyrophosphatase MutT (NUDIX family)
VENFDTDGRSPRTQVAALCWRVARGRVEVLLVTSRETGRWIIPKGWPMPDATPGEAAAREAWEEAGVRGELGEGLGLYTYDKVLDRSGMAPEAVTCVVAVFPLRVDSRKKIFPEAGQRRVRWFPRDKAARKVEEPALQAIIAGFVPAGAEAPAT